MRLLDLFCCAGGGAMGYHRAGFEVIGVDIKPQPNYPFPFLQRDALEVLSDLVDGRSQMFPTYEAPHLPVAWMTRSDFAAIHASPPCQAFTVYGNNRGHVRRDHPNLIPATRELLKATGLPYVIENVPGAPLLDPIQLCGTSFPPLEVRRHRIFESNVALTAAPCDHKRLTERKYPGSTNRPNGRTVCNIGEYRVPLDVQQRAIGIDWMTLPELSQAIPPAYTEHIGHQLIAAMTLEVAA